MFFVGSRTNGVPGPNGKEATGFLETSFLLTSWYLEELEDLGDDYIALGRHVIVELRSGYSG